MGNAQRNPSPRDLEGYDPSVFERIEQGFEDQRRSLDAIKAFLTTWRPPNERVIPIRLDLWQLTQVPASSNQDTGFPITASPYYNVVMPTPHRILGVYVENLTPSATAAIAGVWLGVGENLSDSTPFLDIPPSNYKRIPLDPMRSITAIQLSWANAASKAAIVAAGAGVCIVKGFISSYLLEASQGSAS